MATLEQKRLLATTLQRQFQGLQELLERAKAEDVEVRLATRGGDTLVANLQSRPTKLEVRTILGVDV